MTAVLFDTDYNTLMEERFRYVPEVIQSGNFRLAILAFAPALSFRHMDRYLFPNSTLATYRFAKFSYKLLKNRLAKDLEKDTIVDVFSFLQRCKDPDTGNSLSDKELSSETATFIVAGKIARSLESHVKTQL